MVTNLVDQLHALGLPVTEDGFYEPIEVFNRMIGSGLSGQQDFWSERCVRTGQRLATTLWRSDDLAAPATVGRLPPRRFKVELSRRFDVSREIGRRSLRLRLPLPIEDIQLRGLAIDVADCPGADIRIGSGRIEAKIRPEGPEVTISAIFTFEAHPGPPVFIRDPLARSEAWLAEQEGPIHVTAAISARAARLCQGASSQRECVQRLYNHLLDDVTIGMVAYDARSSATEPAGWLDCRLASVRLVALCRAMGIPARLVSGYLLWDTPSEHYWMEALIDGDRWAPFDFLAWDLSAGGRIAEWRGVYAGAIDYRMKTQCFPDIFTGVPGLASSRSWRRLYQSVPGGTETRYVDADDAHLLYAETVRVMAG